MNTLAISSARLTALYLDCFKRFFFHTGNYKKAELINATASLCIPML